MAPVLGYWNIRGLAEPIRYLLSYLKVDFEDKRYEFGAEPNYLDNEWVKHDKDNLGLELPNIPYYIDGDTKITQSIAIMRHLSRKHKMFQPNQNDENELVRFEVMEGHVRDVFIGMSFFVYNPSFEVFRDLMKERFLGQLKCTAEFLKDKKWLFGDQISYIDFLLYEALDWLNLLFPGLYSGHDNLVKFVENFKALPGVDKYLETSMKWPLFSPFASWGGKGDPPTQ